MMVSASWVGAAASKRVEALRLGKEGPAPEGGGEGYAEEEVPLTKEDVRVWSIECQAPALGSLGLIHQRSAGLVVLVPLPLYVLIPL